MKHTKKIDHRLAGFKTLPEGYFWRISRTRLNVVIEILKSKERGGFALKGVSLCSPEDFEFGSKRLEAALRAYHDAFDTQTTVGSFQ